MITLSIPALMLIVALIVNVFLFIKMFKKVEADDGGLGTGVQIVGRILYLIPILAVWFGYLSILYIWK